jgi:DNA invertase Pin-like site-specific DNA recombinase
MDAKLKAALAQAESESKSENIKWGICRRMEKGKPMLNHVRFLGYTKGKQGELVVVPEEAEIVKLIFELYLQGNGVRKIKRYCS